MRTGILDYLEESAARVPKKAAITDENESLTYEETVALSKKIGTALSGMTSEGSAVAVFAEKSVRTLCTFFGSVYAGCFYTLFNPELPQSRLLDMQEVVKAGVIVAGEGLLEKAQLMFPQSRVVSMEELCICAADEQRLLTIRRHHIDTDPLYLNFTSGSTGVPKGILVGHRSVLDFIDCFTELFSITESDVIANQAPFDFDVSVKDIYSAVKTGAELVLIPRRLFSAPVELVDFLCDHKATTLIWAVSALCLLSTFHGLDYKTPQTVNKVLFSGEVMPYKHLKNWRTHLPQAMFVNLYGPTEITCNCTYHILDPNREYDEGIPIGQAFPNEDVFLLSQEGQKITDPDTVGEICVRGTALALGYFENPSQTELHFVQNPLQGAYPERIYKTGDLGRISENGDFVFCGRVDFQIKYMGHRIELEEVERAMAAIAGVERACCVFEEEKSKLYGFFVGSVEKDELHRIMKETLPVFMVPGALRKVEAMPLTKNGKIDRKLLMEMKKR